MFLLTVRLEEPQVGMHFELIAHSLCARCEKPESLPRGGLSRGADDGLCWHLGSAGSSEMGACRASFPP